jgi:hypothetical protein
MIEVAALTAGQNVPSSRFRIRQFIEPLSELGIGVREYRPWIEKYDNPPLPALGRIWSSAKLASRLPGLVGARRHDVVWLERELLAGRFTLERFLPRRSVLDVDDAVWLRGRPGHSERIAGRCLGVIAGNSYIAEHYRPFTPNVWTVPTCVDTDRWLPRPHGEPRPWTIGWIGTSANLEYLHAIERPLADFLDRHGDSELLVVSNEAPSLTDMPPQRWRFEKWSAEKEVDLVSRFDVGLMPLPDTDWARGKCGAKMLLYMALEIPALVTPVGSNADILGLGQVGLEAREEKDWGPALEHLHGDRSFARACGRQGRRVALESFSVRANVARLADIFGQVARG